MTNKYAILLDGGFVIHKIKETKKAFPEVDDVLAVCEEIINWDVLKNKELLRTYFYHAPPASGILKNPIDKSETNLNTSMAALNSQKLLDLLEMKPNFALRLGETISAGWQLGKNAMKDLSKNTREIEARDFVPNITQKGVDLRIGLDIARLSLRQLVDVIVVVTGDSDMVPAFKFARREGIKIYLHHMKHGVRRDLKAHSDLVF